MRVPTVSKVNIRKQQNPQTSQNTISAVTGKTSVGNSFEECIKSFYQQKDPQKKARSSEYKTEDALATDSGLVNMLPESDSSYIDIKR